MRRPCKGEVRGQSTDYRLQRRQQRGMVGWSIEYRGMPKRKGDSAKASASRARPKGAKVEIGRRPVQKCKGGGQRTEYGVRITEKTTEGDGWLEYRV